VFAFGNAFDCLHAIRDVERGSEDWQEKASSDEQDGVDGDKAGQEESNEPVPTLQ
jgi:hypothetical protein